MKQIIDIVKFNSLEVLAWFISRWTDILENIDLYMSTTQGWYIRRMKAVGYKINPGGMCFGMTHMAIQAFLADDMKTFNQRLQIIKNMPIDDFENDYAKLRARQEQFISENKTLDADKICANIIDISAFFDGVALYQDSEKLFTDNIKSQDALKIMPVLRPVRLDKKGKEPVMIESIFGNYDKADLITYISTLQNHLNKYSFSLHLSASRHAASLHFNHKTKQWLFIDPNKLPGVEYDDSALLAEALLSAYWEDGTQGFIMRTNIYTIAIFIVFRNCP